MAPDVLALAIRGIADGKCLPSEDLLVGLGVEGPSVQMSRKALPSIQTFQRSMAFQGHFCCATTYLTAASTLSGGYHIV